MPEGGKGVRNSHPVTWVVHESWLAAHKTGNPLKVEVCVKVLRMLKRGG